MDETNLFDIQGMQKIGLCDSQLFEKYRACLNFVFVTGYIAVLYMLYQLFS